MDLHGKSLAGLPAEPLVGLARKVRWDYLWIFTDYQWASTRIVGRNTVEGCTTLPSARDFEFAMHTLPLSSTARIVVRTVPGQRVGERNALKCRQPLKTRSETGFEPKASRPGGTGGRARVRLGNLHFVQAVAAALHRQSFSYSNRAYRFLIS